MSGTEKARIYVGADRSQSLAVRVLEHSIKRFASIPVEVLPMIDLPVPHPIDPRNGQRTGFSFSRFCIPALAGYSGKAIYMDADMLVFRDIRELWEIPFDGAKVVIQREVKHTDVSTKKEGAPKVRKKQCAVMLLDCSRLDWRIENIVKAMDEGKYDYDQLMSDLCILDDAEVKYGVPFEWNSLEYFDADTRLLHYTDMHTQPWTSTLNRNGDLWLQEVRRMLRDGSLTRRELEQEIELGYFRPSLLRDITWRQYLPKFVRVGFDNTNRALDKVRGFVPHKAVYEQKRIRDKAIKDYEARLAAENRSPLRDKVA
jgi:hypothetical protein